MAFRRLWSHGCSAVGVSFGHSLSASNCKLTWCAPKEKSPPERPPSVLRVSSDCPPPTAGFVLSLEALTTGLTGFDALPSRAEDPTLSSSASSPSSSSSSSSSSSCSSYVVTCGGILAQLPSTRESPPKKQKMSSSSSSSPSSSSSSSSSEEDEFVKGLPSKLHFSLCDPKGGLFPFDFYGSGLSIWHSARQPSEPFNPVWHSDLHRPFDPPPPPPRPPPLPSSASASSLIGLSKKEVKRRAGVAIAKAIPSCRRLA